MAVESTYQNGGQMGNEALERRLRAINMLMSFSYGSLWVVGENIWKSKLVSRGYDANSTRVAHPGICVQDAGSEDKIHAVVPMLHGTSGKTSPAYQIRNFFNEEGEENHICYFGVRFGAVPIEIEKIRARRILDTDLPGVRDGLSKQELKKIKKIEMKRREIQKNIVRPNEARRQLNTYEVAELRAFVRRYISIA